MMPRMSIQLHSRFALFLLPTLMAAAGCAATPPPVAPPPAPPPVASVPVAAPSAAPAPPRDPFAVPGSLQKEAIVVQAQAPADLSKLVLPPLKPKGKDPKKADPQAIEIGPAPKECGAYLAHKTAGKGKCDERTAALALLDEALGESDALKRDAKLAPMEACGGIPAGMIRALRAELAPAECADVLVAPVLTGKKAPAPDVHQVLLGLGLGARLRRAAIGEPKLAPPFEKPRVLEFIRGPMAEWIAAQAKAVEQISTVGVGLSGYARGIVAVEAGMADMRIVEVVRAVPLPDEFAKDTELKDAYFAGIEQGLDPRKARGRDAALIGLRDLASVGVIADPRVDRARGLLSKVFGGRRIDALDTLAAPVLPAASSNTVEQRLAARLPTFYAGVLLAPEVVKDAGVMRQMAQHGVPSPQRKFLQDAADLPRDIELLALRARLSLGQRYWRAVDFDEATALAVKLRGNAGLGDETTFLLALSLALRGGPKEAAEMMAVAPALSLGLGNIAGLDAIRTANPPVSLRGMAALDAAMVLEISPSDKPDTAFWSALANRYKEAADLLTDPELKAVAQRKARAADEVAKAVAAHH
jgi:hypothetical protein